MITTFEGRIGSGKTYTAVERIVNHLGKGGVVVTNIALDFKAIAAWIKDRGGDDIVESQLREIPNDKVGRFHKHIPFAAFNAKVKILVVLDEAHLYFNARDWSQTDRELLAFLTQSRKVGVDIIFITQSVNNLDKQFMRLNQDIYRFRDAKEFKIEALGLRWPFDQIVQVQFDYDGKTVMERRFKWKNKRVFGCYKTDALLTPFASDGTDNFYDLTKPKPKQKTTMKTILALITVCLVIVGGCVYYFKMPTKAPVVNEAKPKPVFVAATSEYEATETYQSEDEISVTTERARYEKGRFCRYGKVKSYVGDVLTCISRDGREVRVLIERPVVTEAASRREEARSVVIEQWVSDGTWGPSQEHSDGSFGPVFLPRLTSIRGAYIVGQPTEHGVVLRIEDRTAYIEGWDGREVKVVVLKGAKSNQYHAVATTPVVKKVETHTTPVATPAPAKTQASGAKLQTGKIATSHLR